MLARAYGKLAVAQDTGSPDAEMLRRAFSILTRYVDEGGSDPSWNKLAGFILFNLGLYTDALPFFERANRLDPGDGDNSAYIEACRSAEEERRRSLELYEPRDLTVAEAHIREYFGEPIRIFRDPNPNGISIDIILIPPTDDHNCFTLVTLGMGAHMMTLPDDLISEELGRAELLVCLPTEYVNADAPDEERAVPLWAIHMLRGIARLPLTESSWLGWGHTVASDWKDPEGRIKFNGAVLVTPGKFGQDASICHLPSGDDLNFYQLVPLYADEIKYKLRTDVDALLDCFSDDMLAVIDPGRPPVVDRYGRAHEYGINVDSAAVHLEKIRKKRLFVNELSAYSHMAIYLRWCMEHDLMSDVFLDRYEYLAETVRLGRGSPDLRVFLRADKYLNGELTLPCFNCDGVDFTRWYYMSGNEAHSFFHDIDLYAERVFGSSRCRGSEFSGEAYLFIPWSEQYYRDMASLLNKRFEEWMVAEGIGEPADDLYIVDSELRDLLPGLHGPRGCLATDSIMFDGQPIGACFRERPAAADRGWDSGWRFMTVEEYEEYMDGEDPSVIDDMLDVYDLNTVCNYDPDIAKLLDSPYGSHFEHDEGGFYKTEY